jgi:hypothetical protein
MRKLVIFVLKGNIGSLGILSFYTFDIIALIKNTRIETSSYF